MSRMRNLIYSTAEYTRSYSGFRGVRLGADREGDLTALAYAENMYRDYSIDSDGAVESIPGFRKILSVGGRIYGIFRQKTENDEFLLVHAGTELYRMPLSVKDGVGEAVKIGELTEAKSCGFAFGSCFYILDSRQFYRIDADGSVKAVGTSGTPTYVPTLYVQGEAFEQRNLLTNSFREEFYINDASRQVFATEGLMYSIIDPALKKCAVTGVEAGVSGELHIPGYITIGDTEYRVCEIADNAFTGNSSITSVKINEGVERIGKFAFQKAEKITVIYTPNSLLTIDNAAFADARGLTDLYLGTGLETVGSGVLSTTISLETIHYALGETELQKVTGNSIFQREKLSYNDTERSLRLLVRVFSNASTVMAVKLGEKSKGFSSVKDGSRTVAVTFSVSSAAEANGKTVIISGLENRYYSAFDGNGKIEDAKEIEGYSAIVGCRIATIFDGRIFLSGNPHLPNTVFYSTSSASGGTDPLYFGHLDYFNDGIGNSPVKYMLAVKDALAVFKSRDDGAGSIFYHVPKDTGEELAPRIYPTASVHSGICCLSEAISFFDDPVFVSKLGITALEMKQLNYDRSIAKRSTGVNTELLTESLENASLAVWQGYLTVLTEGRIYLADSRRVYTGVGGHREYEWFVLKGIGTFNGDRRVYRFSSVPTGSARVYHAPDTKCDSMVYSYKDAGGNMLYFTIIDGVHYSVYPTEEMTGGSFSAAVTLYSDGDLLFFGTESGDVCVFNTDKRGVPPDRLKASPDFDAEEYAQAMGNRIHPDFYGFDLHAPRYAIKTCVDNCGVPHLTKNTVKNSLTVKCKAYSSTLLHCEVGTDKTGYSEVAAFSPSNLDFDEISFDRLSISCSDHYTLPLREKSKNWIEKQVTLYSDEFRCPIGIYSITFRYTIKGKIKKT